MLNNFLKLNDSKTEFLILSSKHNAKKLDNNLVIKIGESTIKRSYHLIHYFHSVRSSNDDITFIR